MAVGPWPDAGAVPSGHASGPGFRAGASGPGRQVMPQGQARFAGCTKRGGRRGQPAAERGGMFRRLDVLFKGGGFWGGDPDVLNGGGGHTENLFFYLYSYRPSAG